MAPQPGLTVAAVARRLGVAPATLRSWDRRYGIGPGAHVAGTRRRYEAGDLARLEVMRRLVLRGVSPAAAAAAALLDEPEPTPSAVPVELPAHEPVGGGAGIRGLGRAVMALDEAAARGQLIAALRAHGVIETWETLLRPLLRALGDRWAATGEGIETEHLLSVTTVNALREALVDRPPASTVRPVLLASAEDDQHSLPLHVLEAALAERGVAARTLGGTLPAASLHAAVLRTGPAAVLVWAQLTSTARPEALDELPQTRPGAALFVGGPGWSPERMPRRAQRLDDLGGAVRALARAAG